jgi:predicted DCC family thiol-disulfide oxidoreductase YuxK
MDKSLILFDGVCNLCNASVRFIIKRDKYNRFQFANLQSEFAIKKLKEIKLSELPDSLVLINGQNIYFKSDAVFEIIRSFSKLWHILLIFKILPKRLRDFLYDIIAKYRYKIFGKEDVCQIPDRSISGKFIES